MTPTPIDTDRLAMELAEQPDRVFVTTLITGLREGFFTGISVPPLVSLECPNNMSAKSHPQVVDDVVRFNTHFYCKHKSQQSAIFDPEATDDH